MASPLCFHLFLTLIFIPWFPKGQILFSHLKPLGVLQGFCTHYGRCEIFDGGFYREVLSSLNTKKLRTIFVLRTVHLLMRTYRVHTRVFHIKDCKVNCLWLVEELMMLINYGAGGFRRFLHLSFINQFSKMWHILTSTIDNKKGAKIQLDTSRFYLKVFFFSKI